eukprot:5648984-Pyramimonas_sp.AAC.1
MSSADTISHSIQHDAKYSWAKNDKGAEAFLQVLADLRAEIFNQAISKAMTEPSAALRKALDDDT